VSDQKHTGVIAVADSANRKTGPVAVTYVSQASCPTTCTFRGAGCYAELGMTGIHTSRVNQSKDSAVALARKEAAAIDALKTTHRPMRLHVVGDCKTPDAARIVSAASERYTAKNGQPTWTYTHAWRSVPREAWGRVSVLASVETLADAAKALKRGYASAVVVGSFPSDGKAYSTPDGLKVIPCPAQTAHKTCIECRLCMNADSLVDRKAVIAFEAHGSRKNKILRVLQD